MFLHQVQYDIDKIKSREGEGGGEGGGLRHRHPHNPESIVANIVWKLFWVAISITYRNIPMTTVVVSHAARRVER